MPTLREVRKRIRSVKSTRRITSAMEMVAAARLRRAQQRAEQAKPYARKMDEMLRNLATGTTQEIVHPFFEERPVAKRTLVLVTSDRGLCGSYNSNIIRMANVWLKARTEAENELVTVGKRGNDFFKRQRQNIIEYYGDWSGALDYDRVRSIVAFLTERFVSGMTDRIDLLYTRFESAVKFRPCQDQYLPIAKPTVAEEEREINREYIFEPTPERIYAALMPGYATTKMVTALAQSFASEHGSRMIAMNAATKNAGEMIDDLTLDYNKARQAQITKELLDIVGGAEALAG